MTDPKLKARLRERLDMSTKTCTKAFGHPPSRWLQLEEQHGTLGACQLILSTEEFVDGLTPMWEQNLLHESVEAIALESEFAPLFTPVERAEARRRLTELGFFKPSSR